MNSTLLAIAATAALLLFWSVGAYNRLMGLRNTILRRFPRFDDAFQQRHALLMSHLDGAGAVPNPAPASDEHELRLALRAAGLQALRACEALRARPGSAGAAASLRLAEGILQSSMQRLSELHSVLQALPEQPGLALSTDHRAQQLAAETALQYARGHFNAAVMEYNRALQQFPAAVLAAVLGFRSAGTV
jgi:LemA protein